MTIISLSGCNGLAAGPTGVIAKSNAASKPTTPVILIRGWRDLWSDGIDRLADRLNSQGIEAAVFKEGQSSELGDALETQAKAHALKVPIVLIGFSYGADDVIHLARRLAAIGQTINLLILIDPVTPEAIPTSVGRCVNFYQSNGVWDAFPWLRGVPVKAETVANGAADRVANIDIRTRLDLVEPDTSHKTIAANTKLHSAIVAEVEHFVPHH